MHPLCRDIEAGQFDEMIEELETAVKNRRSSLTLVDIGFNLGDHVKIGYDTSPRYLNQFPSEVVGVRESGEVIIKSLAPRARGRRFRVRPSRLVKVAA